MIIKTTPYSIHEILQILSIRAKIEGLSIDDEALAILSQIGSATSLRYSIQLLTPSNLLASANGRNSISKLDVENASNLFLDAKASAKLLHDNSSSFIR